MLFVRVLQGLNYKRKVDLQKKVGERDFANIHFSNVSRVTDAIHW